MSNLKYKLLLCVVVVMALAVPLYAAEVTFWTENFDGEDPVADWSISSGSDWEVGTPVGAVDSYDPSAAYSPPNELGYQIDGNGLYANSISSMKYARTPAIDCTGKTGVQLSFERWLSVEDSQFDQAVVQVSNNNLDWTLVWMNPTEYDADADDYVADLVDGGWKLVQYDISAVADNQATVYVRWGLQTNGSTQYGGWNIDDVELSASAPDAIDVPTWTPDAGVWEFDTPSVGSSGQTADWDNDPETPDTFGGADPATDSSGGTDPIWGTVIGGNYPPSMDAQYLTSSDFDCTGHSNVAVHFMRWLQVADGAYDEASVQVQVADPDTDAFDDVEVASYDTAVSLAVDDTYVYPTIDTTDMYDVTFTLDYDTDGMASDHFYVEVSRNGEDWDEVLDITTDTNDSVDDGVVTIDSGDLPLYADDNPALYVRLRMAAAEDAGTAAVSNLTVSGQHWAEAWHNPSSSPELTNTVDEDWTETYVSIAAWADGAKKVRVRFAMGPTSDYAETYGGWSLDKIDIVEGSREFRGMGVDAPAAMTWGDTGDVTVTLRNTGTATWDDSYAAYEVDAAKVEVPDLGNPDEDKVVPAVQVFPINRWGVGSIAVDGTVAPRANGEFAATITAPPLSSVVYATPVEPTAPADLGLSVLGLDWALGNETAESTPDIELIPSYMNGGGPVQPAVGGVVVTRFPDDQPGTTGAWARFQIEELAGAVPFIVQGYEDGTYKPEGVVDRAAIAVYIQRAAQVPSSGEPLGSMFRDVPSDHWAVNQIQAVAEAGIVQGYGADTYQPDTLVTRDQMCKFIVNGVDYAMGGGVDNDLGVVADVNTLTPDTYPFGDVALDDPDTEDVSEANPLAGFILAASDAGIVQGYAVPEGSPEDTLPDFVPGGTITRDQLAVFVWRGFLRGDLVGPSVVALGGPGITDAILADDITPTGGGVARYSGLSSLAGLVQAGDDATAYVTLDALRLRGWTGDLNVDFDLSGGSNPTTLNVVIPEATVSAWVAQITSTDENSDTDGQPYKTVAVPLNTAKSTGLDHGVYTLTVSVDGKELSRKPTLELMSDFFFQDMEGGLPSWEVTGTPGTVDIYGDSTDPDNPEDNEDLYDDTQSLMLQLSQAVQFGVDTTDRHDIRLSLDVAATDLADADTITIQWSKDDGATWITAGTITGADAPDALETVTFNLPNGLEYTDPEAWADLTTEEQGDPANWGADNNDHFMVKIGVNVAGEDGRVYIDNVELRGT